MLLTAGLCLIALAVAMVVIARPADGVAAPFLTSWAVGQSYALAALTSGVLGTSLVLSESLA